MRRWLILWLCFLAASLSEAQSPNLTASSPGGAVRKTYFFIFWFEPKEAVQTTVVLQQSFFAGVPYSSQQIHSIETLSPEYTVEEVTNHDFVNSYKLTLNGPWKLPQARPYFYGFAADVSMQNDLTYTYDGPDIQRIALPEEFTPYLSSAEGYDYESETVKKVVAELLQGNPGYHTTIKRVWEYVNRHVTYTYGEVPRPNKASDIIVARKGKCGEFSKLTATLLRGAGIPARTVSSLGADPYFSKSDHAWVEAYIPNGIGWVPVQPQLSPPAGNQYFASFRGYYVLKRYIRAGETRWIHASSYKGKGKMGRGYIGVAVDLGEHRSSYIALVKSLLADSHTESPALKKAINQYPVEARILLYWLASASTHEGIATMAVGEFKRLSEIGLRKEKMGAIPKLSPELVRLRLTE